MIKVRASMLPRAVDCMRAAAVGQFPDLIEDSGVALSPGRIGVYTVVGTGTHAAGEFILTEKINTGKLPKIGEAIGVGIDCYRAKIKEDKEITFDNITPSTSAGENQINVLTKAYYRDVAPRLVFPEGADPTDHLELYLKSKIGEDAELSGHIDTRTIPTVLDTKSGKLLRPAQTQLGGYGNLLIANGYDRPENMIVAHLPRVHIDKPYPGTTFEMYDVEFCLNEAWYVTKQIIRDVKNFKQSGNPACFPANPQSTLCGPKYCRCYGTKFCQYY